VAKSHHHNTREQTKRNTPRRRPYTPTGLGGGSLPDFFRMFEYDGRGCRSNGRLRRPGTAKRPNAPLTFLPATATTSATSLTHVDSTPLQAAGPGSAFAPRTVLQLPTTLRQALQPLQTTASSRPHRKPLAPVPVRPGDRSALTPAVTYDGDLVVSRRTLAPVLSGEPTQHPAFLRQQRTGTAVPHSQRRQPSRCEAPLRLTQSVRLGAI